MNWKARLGYIPGYHRGAYHVVQRKLFGTRRLSRQVEFRVMKPWLAASKGRVLDLACGDGDFSWPLALEGHPVVGVDLDRAALARAAAIAPRFQRVSLVAGNAQSLPFADATFDTVLSNSAFEHFNDDERAFAEVARVLRPGGRFVLTVDSAPARLTVLARLLPHRWLRPEIGVGVSRSEAARRHHRERHHVVRYYSTKELSRKLDAAGFDVLSSRSYLAGAVPRFLYEAHVLLKALDFYNNLSLRLYPLFHVLSWLDRADRPGYGLALLATRR
jgi:ubiquinone/menaquinone biosynthesis C-methylase UbiE